MNALNIHASIYEKLAWHTRNHRHTCTWLFVVVCLFVCFALILVINMFWCWGKSLLTHANLLEQGHLTGNCAFKEEGLKGYTLSLNNESTLVKWIRWALLDLLSTNYMIGGKSVKSASAYPSSVHAICIFLSACFIISWIILLRAQTHQITRHLHWCSYASCRSEKSEQLSCNSCDYMWHGRCAVKLVFFRLQQVLQVQERGSSYTCSGKEV